MFFITVGYKTMKLSFSHKLNFSERLKFAAAYWVPSAGAEATGGKTFSADGMYNCDLIIITLPEGC